MIDPANMAGVRHPAQDAWVECCGERYLVRRTLDLLRRLEQIAGPAWPLSLRLRRAEITQDDLALLFEASLRDEPGAPSRADIRGWLFEQGTHKPALAMAGVVASLSIGNAALRALHGADAPAASVDGEGGDETDPTPAVPPTAARTGR